MEYEDIATLSARQQTIFYNAGVMMNGRIYSVDVQPQKETCITLNDIREKIMLMLIFSSKMLICLNGYMRKERNMSFGTEETEANIIFQKAVCVFQILLMHPRELCLHLNPMLVDHLMS